MKIYDLTQKIENGMSAYCEEESPKIQSLFSIEDAGFRVTDMRLTSHLGTHIDVPAHIFQAGKSICDFPLEKFSGRGICLSVNEIEKLDISLLDNIDYLLVYTGWDKYWNNDKYFENYPVLSKNIIEKIADSHLKGIGIDCISPDSHSSEELENHKILLNNEKIIVENLCCLEKLLGKRFYFLCFPLKIDIDGSPVRAIATLERKL